MHTYVLVGEKGFIGRNLLQFAEAHGVQTISPGRLELIDTKREILKALGNIPQQPSKIVLINAASVATSSPNYRNSINNYWYTKLGIELATIAGELDATYVGLGTCLEKLAKPADIYTSEKKKLNNLFESNRFGSRWIWIRLHYIYSRKEEKPAVLHEASESIKKQSVLHLRNPGARHDFLEIEDACQGIFQIIKNEFFGTRDLGSGTTSTVEELVNSLYPDSNVGLNLVQDFEYKDGYEGEANIKYLKNTNWCPINTNLDFSR